MNSLGGKNNQGRLSGARSSRASSTIFKQLRKSDKMCSYYGGISGYLDEHELSPKNLERYRHWDKNRKELRAKRKQFRR